MAKSVNRVTLLGVVGRDPELKYVGSDNIAVVRISVATDYRYKNEQGDWQDKTEWHTVVAWRRHAEIISEYVKKGDRLYVEGHLQTSSWEDQKSGERKYRTEVVVEDLTLLGSRNGQGRDADSAHPRNSNESGHQYGAGNGGNTANEFAGGGIIDTEIPF